MRKIVRTLAVTALAVMSWACAQLEEQEPRALVEREFTAVLDGDFTKTAYTAEKKVVWQDGDVVRYYSYDGTSVKDAAATKISSDGATAQFRLELAFGDSYLIAAYGGTALSSNKENSFTMAGAVKPEQDGTFASAHVSAAKTTDMSGQAPFHFKNLTSLVKFSLTREDVAYVVFSATDGAKLHGNGSINVSFDAECNASAAFGEEGASSIKVKTGGAGTFYLATLPCTLAQGFTIKCYNAGGKSLGVVTSGKSVTLARNDMLNLGVLDSRIVKDESDFYDLSETETANCYIVPSDGLYQFNATVKGNGAESVGAASNAIVLWETTGTSTVPAAGTVIKNVKYVGGYIQFTAGADGNALVAVTDGASNVLWSWHIWVCKDFDPVASQQTYANNAGIMMDRNLGALSATPGNALALGLIYQWGRKDPFPGGAGLTDSTPAATSTALEGPVQSNAKVGTIEYTIAHPTAYIQQDAEANPSDDWLFTSTQLNPETSRWAAAKTIYDPCPAGWRVPDGGTSGIWARAGMGGGTFDSTNRGYSFSCSSPAAWYPATGGYTGEGNLGVVGSQGNWWSCTTVSYVSYTLFFSQSTVDPSTHKVRAMGRSVRCQKTDSSSKTVEVTSVTLNNTSISLSAGKSVTLTATVAPENATNKTVSWSSSNEAVATVSATGIVTAVAEGTATIIASSNNGKTASCEVTVTAKPVRDDSDLSQTSTANCYIVKKAGNYKFDASVRGKSSVLLSAAVASAEVVWESFGTDLAPKAGDIVKDVTVDGNYICFTATGMEGNALIAAKNSAGLIIWSWHIWVSTGFDPAATAQTYANNAAVMMDRNLGALSAKAGDVTSFGLLYQWGRKDPFLAPGNLKDATPAASTYSWPNAVESTASSGTIANSIIYPTTFIYQNSYNRDWHYYKGTSQNDDARWNADIAQYDPCPEGWTVPNGEVWKKAGVPSRIDYDSDNRGMTIGAQYCGTDSWYPFFGYKDNKTGVLLASGTCGYFSRNVDGYLASGLTAVVNTPNLDTQGRPFRARGYSVRCCKEVPVTGITISDKTYEMGGDVLEGKLSATVLPDNAVSKTFTWASSKPEVVSVDQSGNLLAKSAGTATITVTTEEGRFVDSCVITVKEITVSDSVMQKLLKKFE